MPLPLPQVPYTSMEPWSSSKVLPVVKRAHEWVKPYQLVSSYALDRQLAAGRGRPELVLEGSRDQHTWTVRVSSLRFGLVMKILNTRGDDAAY